MSLDALLAVATFVAVLLATAAGVTHLTAAALLGAVLLLATGVLTMPEAVQSVALSQGTLTLLFGMMVLVRALEATGVFAVVAHRLLPLSRGKGSRLLIGVVMLTTVICAWLPNATTVLLIGPLLPPLAQEVKQDPRPLLILLVLTANSAGLLTLIGDPATYIVGTGLGLSFGAYIRQISSAGLLCVLVLLATLPWLYPAIWKARFTLPQQVPPRLHHRRALGLLLTVVAVMLALFLGGELLPVPITPDAVALAGAAASLVIVHQSGLISVDRLLSQIDWSTLIYFMAVFVLIGGLQRTGVLADVAEALASQVGTAGAVPLLLVSTALLSAVVPNIPLVAALTPILIEASRQAGLAGTDGTVAAGTLPLFAALMLGGTLGGNATLIGASANLVGAGIARQQGSPLSFGYWLRFGVPTLVVQLGAAALWLAACAAFTNR